MSTHIRPDRPRGRFRAHGATHSPGRKHKHRRPAGVSCCGWASGSFLATPSPHVSNAPVGLKLPSQADIGTAPSVLRIPPRRV